MTPHPRRHYRLVAPVNLINNLATLLALLRYLPLCPCCARCALLCMLPCFRELLLCCGSCLRVRRFRVGGLAPQSTELRFEIGCALVGSVCGLLRLLHLHAARMPLRLLACRAATCGCRCLATMQKSTKLMHSADAPEARDR